MSSYELIIPFHTELHNTDHNVFWSNLVFFLKSLTGRSNKIVIYLYKDNLDSLVMKILLALIII